MPDGTSGKMISFHSALHDQIQLWRMGIQGITWLQQLSQIMNLKNGAQRILTCTLKKFDILHLMWTVLKRPWKRKNELQKRPLHLYHSCAHEDCPCCLALGPPPSCTTARQGAGWTGGRWWTFNPPPPPHSLSVSHSAKWLSINPI